MVQSPDPTALISCTPVRRVEPSTPALMSSPVTRIITCDTVQTGGEVIGRNFRARDAHFPLFFFLFSFSLRLVIVCEFECWAREEQQL